MIVSRIIKSFFFRAFQISKMNTLIPIFPHLQPFLGWLDGWALGETNKTWLKVLTRWNPLCTAYELYYEIFYPMIIVKDPKHANRSTRWGGFSVSVYWTKNGDLLNKWLSNCTTDWPRPLNREFLIINNTNTMQKGCFHSIPVPRTREKWGHFFKHLTNGDPMGILV